jgi:HSP20 family protein
MSMSGLRENLDRAWGQLQTGWNNLVSKASDALTRFTGGEDEQDEDARTLRRLSPDWGLLAAELRETESELRLRLEMPGMNPDELDVQVHGQLLRISGEKQLQRETDQGRYHVTECAYGRFERQLPLPCEVDATKTRAEYRTGVLMLHLPKQEKAKVRRIPINSA